MGMINKKKLILGFVATLGIIVCFAFYYICFSMRIEQPKAINDGIETSSGDSYAFLGVLLDEVKEINDLNDVYAGTISSTTKGKGKTYKYSNGSKYVGSMKNGKRSGKGTMYFKNGDVYSGRWKNDYFKGSGKYKFKDGTVLTGVFNKKGLIKGKCIIKDDDGKYTITIKNGKVTGYIVAELTSGDIYKGKYSEEAFNGAVKLYYKNGDFYDGKVKEGLKSGTGRYRWSTGEWYEGEWENDMMNGEGKYHFESTYPCVYTTFVNNILDGDYVYYSSNGDVYDTKWSNNKCTSIKIRGN